MLHRNRLLATLAAAALFAPLAPKADEKPFDRTPVDCIIVSRIDKTDIIDDRTVLFFMRGRKEIYRNYLPHNCPNLELEDRFGYQVSTSRLCRSDMLMVLPRLGFPISCRLGDFQPITTEEVEELRAVHEQARHGDGIDVKPVEPPKQDAGGSRDEPPPKGGEPARE
jgi:hypothetical protein